MKAHPFAGLGVALVTPFREDLSIDYSALEVLINKSISAGVDYLLALGTTAETPTLTDVEKRSLISAIIEINAGRVPLVVGMSGNDTARLCQSIREFDFRGVDAVLSASPSYNKPTQTGIYAHFSAVAQVVKKPLILYNIPSRTGVNIEAETTLALAEKFSNIIAVKESSGKLVQTMKLIDESPDRFAVISGDDALTLPLMALGAAGTISVVANAYPAEMAELVHCAMSEDFINASRKNNLLKCLFNPLFENGNPAGIKALLHINGMMSQSLRLPLTPVSDKVYNVLADCAEALNRQSI